MWSGGLASTSISLRKNMGRALCSSAPHIPTTLIKVNYENFRGFSRFPQKFSKFENENEGNIFESFGIPITYSEKQQKLLKNIL